MDYAEQLKQDLAHCRTPQIFAQRLYRTLFENNTSFPHTQKYAGVMNLPAEERQEFFDNYLYFLSTGCVEIDGLEKRLRESSTLKGIKRRVGKAAYIRGIEVSFNPSKVGKGIVEDNDFFGDGEGDEDEENG